MSVIRIHIDEDADAHALLMALRQRGQDVTSTRERGMLGYRDEDQLQWATEQGRVIFTYNASDFCRLHSRYSAAGKRHAGVVIGEQQRISVGEELRRLLRLVDAKSAQEMENNLEFLSNWAAPSDI